MSKPTLQDLDRALTAHLGQVPLFRALLRSLEAALLAPRVPFPEPVLDIGMGDGHFGSVLFRENRPVGLDCNAEAATEATRRGRYAGVVVACAEALPFRSGYFATVLANSTLEHIGPLE